MAGVGHQREGVGEEAKDNFKDYETKVERGAKSESHSEILGRMTVAGMRGMAVIVVVVVVMVVVVWHKLISW